MNCANSKKLIQSGLDGVLTPAERRALDIHLASCAECRAEWDAQRRLAQIAERWAQPKAVDDPGDAFTAAVLAQIAARPAPVRHPSRDSFWWPLAALLCLGAAFMLLPGQARPDLSALEVSARLLPQWLLFYLHSLPGDALALTRTLTQTPPGLAVPHYGWAALLLAAALNSAFCVNARRGRPQRSLS